MTSVYLSMFLIIALAVVISGVVLIGMKGMYRSKVPQVADHLATAARHLNGDAEPPAAFLNVYEQAPSRRNESQKA